MKIEKLEFFINPLKLYPFLNQGKRLDQLVLLHDATEKGYSVIAYGTRILSESYKWMNAEGSGEPRRVLNELQEFINREKPKWEEYISRHPFVQEISTLPFIYGPVGFFSYDFGLQFEKLISKLPHDETCPAYYFVVPEEILIFDHQNKTMWCVVGSEGSEPSSIIDFYQSLKTINYKEALIVTEDEHEQVKSNLTEREYAMKIYEIKNYLCDGETYQVNFSQRFSFESRRSPWEMYKEICRTNPTRFQGFVSGTHAGKKFWVVSNSPERLFHVTVDERGRAIETWPIKGTIGVKGYDSDAEIADKAKALLDSAKDRAELEMIVDMSRNDLGRICEFGSVEVKEHRVLERYSHLFHTVSRIAGRLKKEVKLFDIMRALFPGASITGCPKKRTMEIIDRTEDRARGVYCGSLGYFDVRGGADFNIMIRTLFAMAPTGATSHSPSSSFFYTMNAGGGVVIDSRPEAEYKETFDKIGAFLQALRSN